MPGTPDTIQLTATTLTGFEETLATELERLGAARVTKGHRAVHFEGDEAMLYRANLMCRTAIRILKPLARFRVHRDTALYKAVQRIDWSAFLEATGNLWVNTSLHESKIDHSNYASQVVKDAVVDQFRDATGERPSVDRDSADVVINLRIDRNAATLSVDSSGDSLHRRGYRPLVHETPISEVLAAGIIGLTGWDGRAPFVDGMCGSGTFLIEAAMMARSIPAGRFRKSFGFQRWKRYDADLFGRVLEEATGAELDAAPGPIQGSDVNAGAVDLAREHLERSGTGGDVALTVSDFAAAEPPPAEPGAVLVMNPPYGERVSADEIAGLYAMIGDTLKQRYSGYTAWIFTGSEEGAKAIGLRPSRKIPLMNGPIKCRLLRFEMYAGSRKAKYRS